MAVWNEKLRSEMSLRAHNVAYWSGGSLGFSLFDECVSRHGALGFIAGSMCGSV